MVEEIKSAALAQVAAQGPAALSLRAVSRELGVVSSAVYRYFASRDELLTALIADSYRELGDAAVLADRPGAAPEERWRAVTDGWRGWALTHPHRFQLLYGSPVPGYSAPEVTVPAAAHAVKALVDVVRVAAPHDPPPGWQGSEPLLEQSRSVGAQWHLEAPWLGAQLYLTFGQLVGLVTLELNGHLVGGFVPADELWASAVALTGRELGL